MGRKPTPRQSGGSEFGGTSQQNTVQPRQSFQDLSPKEQARLIKTTGQTADPGAVARARHFHGQAGTKPADPPPSRYPR